LMKCWNDVVQNEPSTISQWMIPSFRESAGSTEYLENVSAQIMHLDMMTYRCPRTKKAFRCAAVPRIDHANPRYVVRRSTELSSTKTSWWAAYCPILVLYSSHFSAERSAATRVICISISRCLLLWQT